MKKLFLFSVTMFLIGVIINGCGSSPSTPEDVAKEFLTRVESGSSSAVDLMAPELIQMLGREKMEGAIKDQAAQMKEKGGIKSIDVTDLKIEGDEATMNVTTNYNNGTSETEDMKMVNKDGDWLITISK